MRVVGSSLVSPGEIPVHLHPMSDADAACCCCCVLLQEPAHFYWIKPPSLSVRVSDDHWASLKLRVDPLARKILDPTRSLLVAAFLIFLFWQVFRAIKPNPEALVFDSSSYLDMDDYTDDNSKRLLEQQQGHQHTNGKEEEHQQQLEYYKQQQLNLYLARKASMEHSLLYWNIGFFTFVFFLMLTTAYLSKGMMDNNACVDELIRNILKEIRQRFQLECGFDISYRTNQRDTRWHQYSSMQQQEQQQQPTDDKRIVLVPPTTNPWNVVLWNSFQNIIFRPQRVIVFTDLFAKTKDPVTDDLLSPTFSSVASSSSPGDNNTRNNNNNNNTFVLYDTSTTSSQDGNIMMNKSSLFPTKSNTNYNPPSSIMDRLPSFSMT